MKLTLKSWKQIALQILCVTLLGGLAHAASQLQKMDQGKKAKISGMIVSRSGDMVEIKVKEGTVVVVNISDTTKFERTKELRLRHHDMDVTAMVPGLTITADGTGNGKGQLDAEKITFDPNVFNIEVAEEQQIQSNKSAAGQAQSTANQGVAAAGEAQSSAHQAQNTADAAGTVAEAAGSIALADADATALVNQRVSDLGDYTTVMEGALFFEPNQAVLAADDKAMLDKLASDAKATQNYMIEIAGYASSTGTKELNQKLSDERATAVAEYLRDKDNVPMRRILAPAGYGASHAAAPNADPMGRDINRRVDVKVLVNKGLDENLSSAMNKETNSLSTGE
jgi:outer membrane protein OmpA-like peptidoglycan-associated protein